MAGTANFNLRKLKGKEASIVAVVRIFGYTIRVATGLTVSSNDWSKKTQRPKGNKSNLLHNKLDSYSRKLRDLLTKTEPNNFSPSRFKDQLAEVFGKVAPKTNSFFDFAEEYCTGNRSDLMCAVKNLRASNSGRDLFFNEVDSFVLNTCVDYLKVKKLEASTINKYISQIKQVHKAAYEKRLHNTRLRDELPKVNKKGSDQVPITLTASEIIALYNLDLKPNLERARDLLLIGILTGQRHSDYSRIHPEMIRNGCICFRQKKTGVSVEIPIDLCDNWGLPFTLSGLLQKYNWHSPKVSKQMFRRYLKRIAKMCITSKVEIVSRPGGKLETSIEFKKDYISSHISRRTFATFWYKLGMPEVELIEYTGHAEVEMLRCYLGITKAERKRKARETARRVSRPITELEAPNNVLSINRKVKTA